MAERERESEFPFNIFLILSHKHKIGTCHPSRLLVENKSKLIMVSNNILWKCVLLNSNIDRRIDRYRLMGILPEKQRVLVSAQDRIRRETESNGKQHSKVY